MGKVDAIKGWLKRWFIFNGFALTQLKLTVAATDKVFSWLWSLLLCASLGLHGHEYPGLDRVFRVFSFVSEPGNVIFLCQKSGEALQEFENPDSKIKCSLSWFLTAAHYLGRLSFAEWQNSNTNTVAATSKAKLRFVLSVGGT